ncbi:MAG: GAF domain-containing protein [Oculatellaceae cyanobacterium bins.114]|nr:GAF domain-containing protein [Oculatellaceae cyanobacterium bins.114]
MMSAQEPSESLLYNETETAMPTPITAAVKPDRTQPEDKQATQQRAVEPEPYNHMLRSRDRLLETVAKATNILLTLENFDEAVNTALNIIMEGAGCDRIGVLENGFDEESKLPSHYTIIYEVAKPGIISQMACLEAGRISNVGREAFMEQHYVQGEGFGGFLEDWDEPVRGVLASVQVKACYAVPIRVNGQWWGLLCIDYCREAVRISPAESAVLKMVADCIGSAIHRDRTHQERAQFAQQRAAELNEYNQRLLRRDRLLEVTARATNMLLTLDNIDVAMESALTVLLEGTGCDRIEILENVYESSSPMPIRYLNTIQKCLEPQFETSPTDVESVQAAELSDAFKKYFLEMDGFGGSVEEWDEPLRSWLATLKIQSTYAVPIRVNGHWWGVLCFDYCRAPIQFNPAEVAVLRTIADCIGSAIQRDRAQKALLEAEQNRVAELARANTAMRHSIDWLAHEPDMNAFLGHLLEELATQVNAQDAMIFLYNAREGTLQPFVGVIDDEITFSPPFTRKISAHEWPGWEVLLRSPNPIQFDLDTDAHLFMPEYLEYHRRRNNQGVVCTLLQQGDEPLGFIGFGCVRKTLSENELELVQSLAQQATLAIQLTQLAEEAKQTALLQERARMAREIHDTLAQAFGGISMQLQAATYFAATKAEKAQTHLLAAQALAKDGLAEARRSVWTLYLETTEYENPDQAIAKFIEQAALSQSAQITLAIDGTPYHLHPDVGLNLLRIAQESITNALRHAHAQTIQVRLSYSAQLLKLAIWDDGSGFEPQSSAPGFGLLGMQHRAARIGATWHLVSQVGQGTSITVTIANPTILST